MSIKIEVTWLTCYRINFFNNNYQKLKYKREINNYEYDGNERQIYIWVIGDGEYG